MLAVDRLWHEEHTTVVSVAELAIDEGELLTAVDVLRFFEKPWVFEALHDAWLEDRERQAENQWLDRYADV